MPSIEDTADLLGYFRDSWKAPEKHEFRTFAMALDSTIAALLIPWRRWPVRNSEDRTPIDSQKRAIIHQRDGGACRSCGNANCQLTVDHIIPRSAFEVGDLRIADRSDNLISACWPCNQAKSNYERSQRKRMGVVVKCWYCLNPGRGEHDDAFDQLPYPVDVLVWCGCCGGNSHVPAVAGWVL